MAPLRKSQSGKPPSGPERGVRSKIVKGQETRAAMLRRMAIEKKMNGQGGSGGGPTIAFGRKLSSQSYPTVTRPIAHAEKENYQRPSNLQCSSQPSAKKTVRFAPMAESSSGAGGSSSSNVCFAVPSSNNNSASSSSTNNSSCSSSQKQQQHYQEPNQDNFKPDRRALDSILSHKGIEMPHRPSSSRSSSFFRRDIKHNQEHNQDNFKPDRKALDSILSHKGIEMPHRPSSSRSSSFFRRSSFLRPRNDYGSSLFGRQSISTPVRKQREDQRMPLNNLSHSRLNDPSSTGPDTIQPLISSDHQSSLTNPPIIRNSEVSKSNAGRPNTRRRTIEIETELSQLSAEELKLRKDELQRQMDILNKVAGCKAVQPTHHVISNQQDQGSKSEPLSLQQIPDSCPSESSVSTSSASMCPKKHQKPNESLTNDTNGFDSDKNHDQNSQRPPNAPNPNGDAISYQHAKTSSSSSSFLPTVSVMDVFNQESVLFMIPEGDDDDDGADADLDSVDGDHDATTQQNLDALFATNSVQSSGERSRNTADNSPQSSSSRVKRNYKAAKSRGSLTSKNAGSNDQIECRQVVADRNVEESSDTVNRLFSAVQLSERESTLAAEEENDGRSSAIDGEQQTLTSALSTGGREEVGGHGSILSFTPRRSQRIAKRIQNPGDDDNDNGQKKQPDEEKSPVKRSIVMKIRHSENVVRGADLLENSVVGFGGGRQESTLINESQFPPQSTSHNLPPIALSPIPTRQDGRKKKTN